MNIMHGHMQAWYGLTLATDSAVGWQEHTFTGPYFCDILLSTGEMHWGGI